MPADLSHFSCEKRGGEQRCGCATLVPKAREKQWWKFTALSFQAGNTAGVNSNPWWWNRSVHSSSGADFHGEVVVFLHIHIYSMATKKQEHNCTDSATKRHKPPSSSDAGLVFETSCLSSLLCSILSVFPAARFLLRFYRRLQIQGFIILLLIFSHNNILTSLIICMESVEVLAATWHTKIDSQKDQIRFRNVGGEERRCNLLINHAGEQTEECLCSSLTSLPLLKFFLVWISESL